MVASSETRAIWELLQYIAPADVTMDKEAPPPVRQGLHTVQEFWVFKRKLGYIIDIGASLILGCIWTFDEAFQDNNRAPAENGDFCRS